jgi:hypothetical protein
MECTFNNAERDSSKWPRGGFVVRYYDSHVLMSREVYVRVRKEEVRIGLGEIAGWSVGSKEFRATYSELVTNFVERFGVSRVKRHDLIL